MSTRAERLAKPAPVSDLKTLEANPAEHRRVEGHDPKPARRKAEFTKSLTPTADNFRELVQEPLL